MVAGMFLGLLPDVNPFCACLSVTDVVFPPNLFAESSYLLRSTILPVLPHVLQYCKAST
jgi:hypothetical protein